MPTSRDSQANADAASKSRKLKSVSRSLWRTLGPFVGLVLITLLFAFLSRSSGRFLTVYNWRTIAVQTVIVGTAALGMTFVMISGGIDLSVGSIVALVTVCIALFIRDFGLSAAAALALGVLVGGVCGCLNGSLTAGLRVVPFIITLGGLRIFRGLAKLLAGNTSVYIRFEEKPWWLSRILNPEPSPSWLMAAPGVWMLLGLCLVSAFVLRFTIFGRYLYAVGSNEQTARLCGIRVRLVKVAVYSLSGLLVGVAGAMQFVFLGGIGDPTTGDGLELQVIAAVVIGGGSLSGGEGTVLGTLIGCLIMSVLGSGCVQAGISNASQDVIIGTIIIAAVAIDRWRRISG